MSSKNRKRKSIKGDKYNTPPHCITKLLNVLDHNRLNTAKFLEPCFGTGAIDKHVPIPEKLKSYAEITQGMNYLKTTYRKRTKKGLRPFDLIITNPPFSLAEEFILKALDDAETVIILLRLNFLGSVKRVEFWNGKVPEPDYLFIITPRPSFVYGGTDSCEYAWFVWDRKKFVDPNKIKRSYNSRAATRLYVL